MQEVEQGGFTVNCAYAICESFGKQTTTYTCAFLSDRDRVVTPELILQNDIYRFIPMFNCGFPLSSIRNLQEPSVIVTFVCLFVCLFDLGHS